MRICARTFAFAAERPGLAAAGMVAAGKGNEPVTYEGAGHGFLRSGEAADASPAARQARADAWSRWLVLLAGRKKRSRKPQE